MLPCLGYVWCMENSPYSKIVSPSFKELKLLLKELRELKTYNALSSKCLLKMNDAAKYTGRSRRTFQNEFHRGIWTSVKIGGGHPRFDPRQLDKDMQTWTQYSKFRRHERGIRD